MASRTEIDVKDIARVIFSGTAAYLVVHFIVLPQLVSFGVSFPAYFYIGVGATGFLSVAIGYLLRPREDATEGSAMYPAE
jgi:hypothetical protein